MSDDRDGRSEAVGHLVCVLLLLSAVDELNPTLLTNES
jgi:hypothetical protein